MRNRIIQRAPLDFGLIDFPTRDLLESHPHERYSIWREAPFGTAYLC
jgi:hypothetical protein